MVRQAYHEPSQRLTVHPEPVEGFHQRFLKEAPIINPGLFITGVWFGPVEAGFGLPFDRLRANGIKGRENKSSFPRRILFKKNA